jgi:hypothetical protein
VLLIYVVVFWFFLARIRPFKHAANSDVEIKFSSVSMFFEIDGNAGWKMFVWHSGGLILLCRKAFEVKSPMLNVV